MKRASRFSSEQAQITATKAAECLARDARVQLVYLFGSAADPARRDMRDIDLGVAFTTPVALDELMRLRADVVAAAGPGIELVALNRAPIVLAWEVANTGRCLFARSSDAEVEFVTRARYWDFKPFLETQWKLAGERLKERGDGAPS
jgi:predicted nucleotidyltransferase